MYLGLDLGTSALKALLIDAEQRVLADCTQSLPAPVRAQPGHSEQDPRDWLQALRSCLQDIKRQQPQALAALRAIGLSGQMHGAVLLDAADQLIRPCILWDDTRSHRQAQRLDADPRFRELGGNIVFPGFTAPKLLWLREHEPDNFARIARVLLPKDYLRWWLSGALISEMSDASGSGWLATGARAWAPELWAATGLDMQQAPDLVEGDAVSAYLRPELAREWGVGQRPVIVAGGGADNAAAAIGLGVIDDGDALLSLGSSGVIAAASSSYKPLPASAVHSFCHALPGRWLQLGVMLSATSSLDWLARNLGQSIAELLKPLGDELGAPGPALFVPYLAGERTPHNDAKVRAAMVGLSYNSGPQELAQALLAGVACALRDNLEALRNSGARVDSLIAVGGGTRSEYWLKLISAVLGVRVDLPEAAGQLGAALGAARLALRAESQAPAAQAYAKPKIARSFTASNDAIQQYQELYQRYRSLHPALASYATQSNPI